MIIPFVNTENLNISQIATLMNSQVKATQTIGCNNWPKEYPYTPDVTVTIAHNGNEILLQYHVKEKNTMARVSDDNGPVWTDSCCECFIAFDDLGYYNIETNCIGKALLGYRDQEKNATHGSAEIMQQIRRFSTLGNQTFEERHGENEWTLTIAVPATAFFRHHLTSFSGIKARINVYKCGDDLSEPHFLSLFPIQFNKPNFHLPQYFQEVSFENR